MLAEFSLSLSFRGSGGDSLRGRDGYRLLNGNSNRLRSRSRYRLWSSSFRGCVHYSFLLSCPSFFLSLLGSNGFEGGLALGFGFSKQFGFGGSLGLIFFSFSEFGLHVSCFSSLFQIFLLLCKQSSILVSFFFFSGFFSSLSFGLSVTKSLLCRLDFETMEFCVLDLLGTNLGIRLTRLRNS